MQRHALRFGFLLAFLSAGCDVGGVTRRDAGMNDGAIPNACFAGGPAFACAGGEAIMCNADGTEGPRTNCTAMGLVCANGLGCRVCRPDSFQCNDNNVEQCNTDGSAWMPSATCDAAAGDMCNAAVGMCTNACDDAAADESYIGCEYYPVTALNTQVEDDFLPAVVVANPQSAAANVTVTGPGGFSTSVSVAAGGTEAIELPWVDELKGTYAAEQSVLITSGAYRLVSTLPVTVYQFNPLEYRLDHDCLEPDGDCDATGDAANGCISVFGDRVCPCDNECFSHSNDASLLLPAHVMTGNYVVMSRPSMLNKRNGAAGASPGFFTVVGVSETPVTVNVQYRGRIVAGSGVTAHAPGESDSYTLNRGDVLQIVAASPSPSCSGFTETVGATTLEYCDSGQEFDLTGTEIRASGPVQVIAGHNCAFVPYNRWACDHLEEAMFPLETWDNETIVSASEPLDGEPNVIRVMSASDGNAITFDPVPSGAPGSMTLNRGQWFEFESRDSFRVSGSAAIMVGQYLVGQDYGGIGTAAPGSVGDPSFSLGIPTEQYRTEYTFLAPTSFTTHYVNVTAPGSATVTLDGMTVTGFQPVGSTGFSVARVSIPAGQHTISGSAPFGIVVYGFGSYTSYMYPGGLDLEVINLI